ncbi:uncharacterized protein LOC119178192 isoform X1 [Rhipicephalus microplus]|uniref:uncharacterized protein LOC119178192 isoform X1 n=1 Tax=Rhipicephalus microplus TaxID=6941 RepID=UPI003F6C43B1
MATSRPATRMAPRTRYSHADDKIILQEVLALNPYENASRWHTIAERVAMLLRRTLNSRSVKERVDLLLAHFIRNDAKNRKKSGTEEEYAAIGVLLQHVADLAAEYSYRPPRSAVRKHRAKNAPASASETASESASGSTAKRVRPAAQASWDDRHIAALECYAAESAAETSNHSGDAVTPAASLLRSMYAREEEGTANDVDDRDTRCHFDWPLSAEAQSPNMSAAGMADERTHTPATTVDGPSTEVRGSHTPSPEPQLTPGTANQASHTPATSADGPSQATHNRTPLRELSTNVPQPLPRGSARAQLASSAEQTPRRRTPLRAGRSQNEATLAFLEARYNQDLEMRLLSYQIDKRKLDLKIRQHDDKMKLLHQQHADNVRLREAEMEMRRMEMAAVLEERRANAAYQASQLQLIKEIVQGKKE